jgi:two-component system NtrC family sensor kinase
MRVVESIQVSQPVLDAYQEIAVYVRNLLHCEYALVAMAEEDSIRVKGCACRDGETYGNLASELIASLGDWGPMVVDDARLITAPILIGNHAAGVLVGYSSTPGTFTVGDLESLTTYSRVAAGILANAAIEASETRTAFTTEELLHFSRLVTMGELSACFAHEVTNPLTLILGNVRVIQESLTAGHPLHSNFDVIDRAASRIEEMAKRMLDFGKKKQSRVGRCDIGELIADALRFVQPHIRLNFIEVNVDVESQLPTVMADRWHVMQAIINLLHNAADAMAAVEHRALSITATRENGDVKIVVSDTGPGIAQCHLPRVFEPFFTTKGEKGTGLGLYIAKQVIDEYRGTIDVQTSDRGTSFTISLPL